MPPSKFGPKSESPSKLASRPSSTIIEGGLFAAVDPDGGNTPPYPLNLGGIALGNVKKLEGPVAFIRGNGVGIFTACGDGQSRCQDGKRASHTRGEGCGATVQSIAQRAPHMVTACCT